MGIADDPELHVETRADWRAWLAENHDGMPGVWLVSWKPKTGEPAVGYDESVEEALCFGWVDSQKRSLGEERIALRFTPRKPQSKWSGSNKNRVAKLEATGQMTDAGRAAIEAAKQNGMWTILDDVEKLIVPPDLGEAFARYSGSRENWDAFSPSARRMILTWIVDAKRDETRTKRIEKTAADAAEGRRAVN